MQAIVLATATALLILAYSVPKRTSAAPIKQVVVPEVKAPEPESDFGDAPDSYGTLRASNGARHGASGPTLGSARDAEPDAMEPLDGKGDGSDDDGVANGMLQPGASASFIVNVSAGGILNAWLDFDSNGKFGPTEQIAKNLVMTPGSNTITVNIPETVSPGIHYGRFRLTSAPVAVPLPTGFLPDGEVEDYAMMIRPAIGVLTIQNRR